MLSLLFVSTITHKTNVGQIYWYYHIITIYIQERMLSIHIRALHPKIIELDYLQSNLPKTSTDAIVTLTSRDQTKTIQKVSCGFRITISPSDSTASS